jgi:hypothetical protein
MRALADIGFKGDGAVVIAEPLLMAVSLLTLVLVLLISPIRGAAMEPAR